MNTLPKWSSLPRVLSTRSYHGEIPMRFKRRLKMQSGTMDMTPLIDVVFQLLLFFMLSSSFILQPGIRISLPRAETSKVSYDKMDIITLARNHRIFFNDAEISREQINNIHFVI